MNFVLCTPELHYRLVVRRVYACAFVGFCTDWNSEVTQQAMSSPPKSRALRRKKLSTSTQKRKATSSRARRGSGAGPFVGEAAAIPEEGGVVGRQEMREGDEEGEERAQRNWWPFLRVFVENKYLVFFFRQGGNCFFPLIFSLLHYVPHRTHTHTRTHTHCHN